jgi:hypothetical protein
MDNQKIILISVFLIGIVIYYIMTKHENFTDKSGKSCSELNKEDKLINDICYPRTDEWYYNKNMIDPIMYMDNTNSWWHYMRDRNMNVQLKPDTQAPMSQYDQNKFINSFGYDFCGKTDYRKSKPAGRLLNTTIPYLN